MGYSLYMEQYIPSWGICQYLSGKSFCTFHQTIGQLKDQPFFEIVKIDLCQLGNPLYPVEKRTSVYEKSFCCLKCISFQLEIDLQGFIQLRIIFAVIILQHMQSMGTQKLRRKIFTRFFQNVFQKIFVKAVTLDHAVVFFAKMKRCFCLKIPLGKLKKICKFCTCPHFK